MSIHAIAAACFLAGGLDPEVLVPRLLDGLLAEYRALGLPFPPADAKLVRYELDGPDGETSSDAFRLAFLARPETATEGPVLLWGPYQWEMPRRLRLQEVPPDAATARGTEVGGLGVLPLALQCHARGWTPLARYLLEKDREGGNGYPQRGQLVQQAWFYWEGQLVKPGTDRRVAAARLKGIIPRDKELDTEANRKLLRDLDLTLVPGRGQPGTVEALIDDLVDYQANANHVYEPEDRYWRIARLGFDAVPALIAHLGDDRLTRAEMTGMNNFVGWNLRVGDVVADLLEGLAGRPIGGGRLDRLKGYRVDRAEAERWWAAALKAGEEAYLLANVVTADPPGDMPKGINRQVVAVIEAKYPRHVPDLYRKYLKERPDLRSWVLVEAVQRSRLSAREKVDVLLAGAEHRDYKQRLPALGAIKDLDRKRFTPLWLAAIEGLPIDLSEPYWSSAEVAVAELAADCDDPRAWTLLEKVARRSALGLRMELLHRACDPGDARSRREKVRLLAAFLDDPAVRDESTDKRFGGPGAGSPYKRIAVRDFAALRIAELLGAEVPLDLKRTDAGWAAVRDRARAAAARELGKAG